MVYSDVLERARSQKKHSHYHYYVYVILLENSVLNERGVTLGTNPRLPCVYVGQSWHEPKERFERHKKGDSASRHVRNYGIRLLEELYGDYNPLSSREEAMKVEAALAEKLKIDGYTVLGGH